jgi:O-antigen/teichoic acid export membrane protein
MSLKKTILANYLGQGWAALMGLAFVPVYVDYLGIEAYGLIGVFAILQAWLTLLDMGMAPTLSREMARFTAGVVSAQSIINLLRSIEVFCVATALIMCLIIWAISGWLAEGWLNTNELPFELVTKSIQIMALLIAARFMESLYRSALIGLQKQVWYNAVNAALATLRSVGAVMVLAWYAPTIYAFFLWQLLVSCLTTFVLALGVHRRIDVPQLSARFSRMALIDIFDYARGMAIIVLLSLLLTQIDKILLSRMLSLDAFGIYTLAATVSGALYVLITPITTAIYPRLVELLSRQESAALVLTYHRGAQILTIITAPGAFILMLFGDGVVFAWSGDANLSLAVGPILSVLAIGTLLNGMMTFPYILQLAYGWTSLTIRINVVAVSLIVPLILWSVPLYGSIGAAWVWFFMNSAYVLIGAQLMYRNLLNDEKWKWYMHDLAGPAIGALSVLFIFYIFRPTELTDRWHWLVFLLLAIVLTSMGAVIGSTQVRSLMLQAIRRLNPATDKCS